MCRKEDGREGRAEGRRGAGACVKSHVFWGARGGAEGGRAARWTVISNCINICVRTVSTNGVLYYSSNTRTVLLSYMFLSVVDRLYNQPVYSR